MRAGRRAGLPRRPGMGAVGLRSGAGALPDGTRYLGRPARGGAGSSRRGEEGSPLPGAAGPSRPGPGAERGREGPQAGVCPAAAPSPRAAVPGPPRQSPHLAAPLKYAADTSSPKVDRA